MVPALLLVLAITWCAAPALAFAAIVRIAPFWGRSPTLAERADARTYLWFAAAGGLLGPALGLAIGLVTRRVAAAAAFAMLLMIGLCGLIVVVLIT